MCGDNVFKGSLPSSPVMQSMDSVWEKLVPKLCLFCSWGEVKWQTRHFAHSVSHKVFCYTVRIWLSFLDSATNTSPKVTNYFVKQCFI